MYKKNSLLLATLFSVSLPCLASISDGYPASQGYQTSDGYTAFQGYQADSKHHDKHNHKHHHGSEMSDEDRKALESYEKEINEIKKEGQDPYFKSNICWGTTAIGLVILGISASNGEGKGAALGGIMTVGAGIIGVYTRNGEGAKVAEREAKIKDRRDRQDRIRTQYNR